MFEKNTFPGTQTRQARHQNRLYKSIAFSAQSTSFVLRAKRSTGAMKFIFILSAFVAFAGFVLCDETDTEKKARDILYDSLPSDTVDADKKLKDVEEYLGYDPAREKRLTSDYDSPESVSLED